MKTPQWIIKQMTATLEVEDLLILGPGISHEAKCTISIQPQVARMYSFKNTTAYICRPLEDLHYLCNTIACEKPQNLEKGFQKQQVTLAHMLLYLQHHNVISNTHGCDAAALCMVKFG